MAEYIEKETVIANLMEQIEKGRDTAECEATELVIKRFAEYISSFPAADVQPVKRGEWVKCGKLEGKIVMKCSVCEQGITSMFAPKYHYCPNCGARMDE